MLASYKSVTSPDPNTCLYISEFPRFPYSKTLNSTQAVPVHGGEQTCRLNHMRLALFPDAAHFQPIVDAVGKTDRQTDWERQTARQFFYLLFA